MNKVHIGPDEHAAIADAISSIHVRLCHTRGALACIAAAAYNASTYDPDIHQAVECITETLDHVIYSVSELEDSIQLAE